MNLSINAAWKPLAALGLALALAGCTGNTAGNTGATTGGGAASSAASTDTLATVGGTAITRGELTHLLEVQGGEQVLPELIDIQLLAQEAKAAGIDVTDADVAAELEDQKKLRPQLSEGLTKNPKFTELLNLQIRRNLLLRRLITKDVKPTDAEVQKFFTTYKSYYQEPVQIKLGRLLTSTKARAEVMSRALKSKTKTFAQLVAEQKKVQDPNATDSGLGDEGFLTLDTLPPQIAQKVEKLPKGGTTEPVEVGSAPNSFYAIFSVTDRKEPADIALATIKPTVTVDYQLAQVAREEVKKNSENPSFDETLQRTRESIRQQSQNPMAPPPPPPSMRDILTAILQPLQNNILTALRAKGTVKIDNADYAKVADGYKAAPTPVPPGADANAAMGNAAIAPAPADSNSAMAPADTNAAPAPAANAAMSNAAMSNAAPAAP